MKITVIFALFWLLTLPFQSVEPVEKPHPCCYCRCGIKDYHKDCHKLCRLPPTSNDKVRMFNYTEDVFCVEVCMLKKEGRRHLKHE